MAYFVDWDDNNVYFEPTVYARVTFEGYKYLVMGEPIPILDFDDDTGEEYVSKFTEDCCYREDDIPDADGWVQCYRCEWSLLPDAPRYTDDGEADGDKDKIIDISKPTAMDEDGWYNVDSEHYNEFEPKDPW